ncbi:hypothetical protein ALP05_02573 [Pseudomonas caricapapayae]|uniref:Uncharacterized protein n=2 Tax=Pseudomonas caricapapayae TaxID=46678 RepID=A0A3M6F0B2_9PSED|nr:hypothetical protein ALP05_02573 [Pseudomonas caricapapayae]
MRGCVVAQLKFSVSSEDCKIIQSTTSGVVSFGVDMDVMRIISPGKVQGQHVVVRLRHVDIPVARSQIGLRGFEPVSTDGSRLKYEVRGRVTYVFKDEDGENVYVSRGLNTYEGNKILKGGIELLYQFDARYEDFEVLNKKLLKLIDSISVH